MYEWSRFVDIASAFAFILAHGASAAGPEAFLT